jgi:hypothetical protein
MELKVKKGRIDYNNPESTGRMLHYILNGADVSHQEKLN